jgi:uncharacterized protein (TIGR03067 family)
MIHNKPDQQLCDDDRLIAVLNDGDQAAEHQEVAEHIEQCSRCQQRFDELAAGAQDWTKVRQALLDDDPCSENQVGSAKWDYSLRNEGPAAWTESMACQLLSPASHPELLGRLGRYDVERLIGSGGMGVVFKAHDSDLNRPVAIKILAPYLSSSGPARKRFAREARAAAAVVHEHVVPIYNVETEREIPFLVMHYIAGESLQGRIDRDGALELCEILRIGMQVASGLSAAHQQGLVHRDIKPSNILMEQGVERALITDFGLARAADDARLTRTGFHPGTPQYMSPEQAAGEQVDSRSDLFSLGSVLYTMCTGRPPFRAETSLGVLRRITDVEPRPIREINPNIPEWLSLLIARLMSKSPEDRFANALDVADLLGQCLAHVQQPAAMPLPEAVAALAPKRTCRPPIGKFIAAVSGAIALIFAGILIVLELDKGTLTIESELDDVPIRIMQGEDVVKELTVSKEGATTRIRAGKYIVEIGQEFDKAVIKDGGVELLRGATVIVKVTQSNANTAESKKAKDEAGKAWLRATSDGSDPVLISDQFIRQTRENLEQIALAFHNYHEEQGHLPGFSSVDGNGSPLLSWRVHLLPYMGDETKALHSEFRLNEAWDSPHNRKLIARMPSVYSVPLADPLPIGHTCYVVPRSDLTLFPDHARGIDFSDIYQGLPNIVLVVEGDRDVATAWTQPTDLPFDRKTPLAHLGNLRDGGFLVSWASGKISFIPNLVAAHHQDRTEFLRGLFEQVGGRGVEYYLDLPETVNGAKHLNTAEDEKAKDEAAKAWLRRPVAGRALDGKSFQLAGHDALLDCVMRNNSEALNRLLTMDNYDLDFSPRNGQWTLLQTALLHECVETTSLLLQHGANPTFASKGTPLPLELAQRSGRNELVELVQKYLESNAPHSQTKADVQAAELQGTWRLVYQPLDGALESSEVGYSLSIGEQTLTLAGHSHPYKLLPENTIQWSYPPEHAGIKFASGKYEVIDQDHVRLAVRYHESPIDATAWPKTASSNDREEGVDYYLLIRTKDSAVTVPPMEFDTLEDFLKPGRELFDKEMKQIDERLATVVEGSAEHSLLTTKKKQLQQQWDLSVAQVKGMAAAAKAGKPVQLAPIVIPNNSRPWQAPMPDPLLGHDEDIAKVLAGTWQVKRYVTDGEEAPLDGSTVTFSKNMLIMHFKLGDEEGDIQQVYRIGSDKIDIWDTDSGPDIRTSLPYLGSYSLENDTLRICYHGRAMELETPQSRPPVQPGKGFIYLELQRAPIAEKVSVAKGETDDLRSGQSYKIKPIVLASDDLKPVAGAMVDVTLIRSDNGVTGDGGFASFKTDEDGIATIDKSLWPGRYQIQVRAPEGSRFRDTEFSKDESILVVHEDGRYSPREFRLAIKDGKQAESDSVKPAHTADQKYEYPSSEFPPFVSYVVRGPEDFMDRVEASKGLSSAHKRLSPNAELVFDALVKKSQEMKRMVTVHEFAEALKNPPKPLTRDDYNFLYFLVGQAQQPRFDRYELSSQLTKKTDDISRFSVDYKTESLLDDQVVETGEYQVAIDGKKLYEKTKTQSNNGKPNEQILSFDGDVVRLSNQLRESDVPQADGHYANVAIQNSNDWFFRDGNPVRIMRLFDLKKRFGCNGKEECLAESVRQVVWEVPIKINGKETFAIGPLHDLHYIAPGLSYAIIRSERLRYGFNAELCRIEEAKDYSLTEMSEFECPAKHDICLPRVITRQETISDKRYTFKTVIDKWEINEDVYTTQEEMQGDSPVSSRLLQRLQGRWRVSRTVNHRTGADSVPDKEYGWSFEGNRMASFGEDGKYVATFKLDEDQSPPHIDWNLGSAHHSLGLIEVEGNLLKWADSVDDGTSKVVRPAKLEPGPGVQYVEMVRVLDESTQVSGAMPPAVADTPSELVRKKPLSDETASNAGQSAAANLIGTWRPHPSIENTWHSENVRELHELDQRQSNPHIDKWTLSFSADGAARFTGIEHYLGVGPKSPPMTLDTWLTREFDFQGKWDLRDGMLSIITDEPVVKQWKLIALTESQLLLHHETGILKVVDGKQVPETVDVVWVKQ